MSRRTEAAVRRILTACAVLFMAAAVGLVAKITLFPPAPIVPTISAATPPTGNGVAGRKTSADPKLDNLATAKMTRTIATKADRQVKAAVPDLSTLIQVKGVFSYGDPKDNEAIIETFQNNLTNSYKMGETVKGVPAVVLKIAKNVTFKYDEREVTLEIKSAERSSYGPVAIPGNNDPYVANGQK